VKTSLMHEIDAEQALIDHRIDPVRAAVRLRVLGEALTWPQHSAGKRRELLLAAASVAVAAILALDAALEQAKLAAP
jgi:hypothetical protein